MKITRAPHVNIYMDKNLDSFLIVDSTLSSNAYYDFFSRIPFKKFNVINVISDKKNREMYDSYIQHLFSEKMLDAEVLIEDSEQLDSLNIKKIFCGGDSGVTAYSELIKKYLPEKSFNHTDIKSNKLSLYNFLKEKNLIKTNQILVSKNDYKSISNLDRASILKPLNGSGGRDTYYVNKLDDLSVLENYDDQVFILMDKVSGPEYSVDFISSNGVHKLNSVWKYTKWDHHHHREEIDLVNPNENPEVIKKIYDFLTKIFSAIDHRDGPTHSEVIISGDDIHLIEINFRLHGHLGNIVQKISIGKSQAVESFLNYDRAKWSESELSTYNYLQPLKKILLNNKKEKYIEKVNWEDFEKCPSVVTIYKHNNLVPGIVPVTTSVQTTLGFVMLTNKDLDTFKKGVDAVRLLKNDLCN